jgi:hypothetical protein
VTTNVSLLVCDDLRLEVNGKLFLIGLYSGNIITFQEGGIVPALHFLFSIDMPIDRPPGDVILEVTLPGEETQRAQLEVGMPADVGPGHTRLTFRHVISVANVPLRAGKIIASANLGGVAHPFSTPWIVVAPAATTVTVSDSNASPPPS